MRHGRMPLPPQSERFIDVDEDRKDSRGNLEYGLVAIESDDECAHERFVGKTTGALSNFAVPHRLVEDRLKFLDSRGEGSELIG